MAKTQIQIVRQIIYNITTLSVVALLCDKHLYALTRELKLNQFKCERDALIVLDWQQSIRGTL